MIELAMLCGIGVLAGCLLMLTFLPLVHGRAVRLTRQHVVEATPLAVNELQADKDRLRAEFAMSVRRLEVNADRLRARAAGRHSEIGKREVQIARLHEKLESLEAELERKSALILTLRTRDAVRKSSVRRIARILLYVFVRMSRKDRRELAGTVPTRRFVPAPQASNDRQAADLRGAAAGRKVLWL